MSLEKPNVVDWLGIEKGTGFVILTLVDDADWSDESKHLSLLQTKLNAYLAFIESGEVFERLRLDVGREIAHSTPIKVSILARYALPSRAHQFLRYVEETFGQAGLQLVHKVLQIPH